MVMEWSGKRYHTLNHHLRSVFGGKISKVSLNAGFTCPNRDGTRGIGGCAFCSPHGSGDYAGSREQDVISQFHTIKEMMRRKWHDARYIAYFQAFTNTYAPVSRLRTLYDSVLQEPDVVGISIATRPDCLSEEILDLLSAYHEKTYLWLELGLQTIHDSTARFFNRGYETAEYYEAVRRLRSRNIRVCTHIILGLPGEDSHMMMETAETVAGFDVQGIKLHLLHLMKETPLGKDWQGKSFPFLERDEYIALVTDMLEIMPPEVVIHRLTGDSPKETLIGPEWSLEKWQILNDIDRTFIQRNTWQGIKAGQGSK